MAINIMSNNGKIVYNLQEIIADKFSDLPVDQITVGSTAYVVETNEHYMINSQFEWIKIATGGSGSGGGSAAFNAVVLEEGQYNPETGVPTILGANSHSMYFVPTDDGSNTEWMYINNTWEKIGSANVDLTDYQLKADTPFEYNTNGKKGIQPKNATATEATENSSFAVGGSAHAKADNSIAVGSGTWAKAHAAVAMGDGCYANSPMSIALGYQNTASANAAFASGYDTAASGNYSVAQNYMTKAIGAQSHAEGYGTTAKGQSSHTEGEGTLTEVGAIGAHAEGHDTKATANNAHAEGFQTVASGPQSHAEGQYSKASAFAAHAEGQNTTASGYYSHSEGYGSIASSQYSHAEGQETQSTNNSAHSEGAYTIASGVFSHAQGYKTIAKSDIQHVSGRFNIEDANSNYAEIVGGGSSEDTRKNIRTLDWYGNATYAGDVIAKDLTLNRNVSLVSINNRLDTIANYESIEFIAEGFEFYWKNFTPSANGNYDTGVAPFSEDNFDRDWIFEFMVESGGVGGNNIFSIGQQSDGVCTSPSLALGNVTYWSHYRLRFDNTMISDGVWPIGGNYNANIKITKVGKVLTVIVTKEGSTITAATYTIPDDITTRSDSHLYLGTGHTNNDDTVPTGFGTMKFKYAKFMYTN